MLGRIRADYPLILSFQACFSDRPQPDISQGGGPLPIEVAPELNMTLSPPFKAPLLTIRPAVSRAVPSHPPPPRGTPVPEERR